eukprot:8873977-Pyramimonas_sp.AAC.1
MRFTFSALLASNLRTATCGHYRYIALLLRQSKPRSRHAQKAFDYILRQSTVDEPHITPVSVRIPNISSRIFNEYTLSTVD